MCATPPLKDTCFSRIFPFLPLFSFRNHRIFYTLENEHLRKIPAEIFVCVIIDITAGIEEKLFRFRAAAVAFCGLILGKVNKLQPNRAYKLPYGGSDIKQVITIK